MNRSELVSQIASRRLGATAGEVEKSVKAILEAISTALANGDRVEVRGFGSFFLNYRPPRGGRNPKSGELVSVPAKSTPRFKAGKLLRAMVDSGKHELME